MLPQTAVMLRKSGLSIGEIADQLGTSPAQVSRWFRVMEFDPVLHFCDQVADLLAAGHGYYAALAECGFVRGGSGSRRMHHALLRRGVTYKRQAAVTAETVHKHDTRPRCISCTILLEPEEHEYCSVCANVRAGGSWLGHMPLPGTPDAVVDLVEVFQYGR